MSTNAHSEHHHHHHHHHDHDHHHDHHHGRHGHDHNHDHAGFADQNAAHFDKNVASPENSTKNEHFLRMYEALSQGLVEHRASFGLGGSSRRTVKEEETATIASPPNENGDAALSAKAKADVAGDARGRRKVRVLDYACGGGHGSRTLLPYADEVRGIDVSAKSVDEYNRWAAEHGLGGERGGEMWAVQGNLLLASDTNSNANTDTRDTAPSSAYSSSSYSSTNALAAPEWHDFDVVICVMALHHVRDPALLVRRLVERLRPGGHIMVIDWNEAGCTLHGAHKHDVSHMVAFDGFSRATRRQYLVEAGCYDAEDNDNSSNDDDYNGDEKNDNESKSDGIGYRELLHYTAIGIPVMSTATKKRS